MNANSEMLDFLKAMSDADRLRIIGLLTQRRASRADIIAKLNLPLRDVVNHLAFLEFVGVLSQKEDVYELNDAKLAGLGRANFAKEHPSYVPAPELATQSKKVLKAYLNADGSIRQIPNQPAKLQVVLNYLIQAFAPNTNYTEKEVNQILRRFHEDTAGLRRDLVDAKMLDRISDGSRYWRVDEVPKMSDEVVTFFKALADANRLKIVGLLAQQPYSVEELAALLNLKASTVSHHLAKLAQVGLVSAKTESYYNVYQLDEKALQSKSRDLFSQENLAASVVDVDADAYDNKVIKDYVSKDGSLKTIPAQRKKLEAILRYVVKAFEINKRYSEKQVNEILAQYHEDTASLRRELVGYGLMKREGGGGDYWRE